MTNQQNGLTYADAGVDIDAGNALVEQIKPAAKRTVRPGVMAGLGCLLYTSPSPRDQRGSRMPSSA